MMILQGHRSNSLSSDDKATLSAYQEARQCPRRTTKPWARDSPLVSHNSERQANLTPFNTMHMPRLDSVGSQERRSHMPIWEPLYMEDTPDKTEEDETRRSRMSTDAKGPKELIKNPFSSGGDGDESSMDYGCCAWKLCVSLMTANWMSRAM
ncbi:uncharacterized protein Bfra_000035 [Botrytis fragariae]|uniref:Uncharacterized protein n=1 Tax=Botrytis fragariae TaxID=1964551 RepID=A0A8H6B2B5_9HELO|nr:uncharacterized protein Bfra_000035 [Botrytis fragariae]KAF5877873.1 hypothetical protein Bfra_000035 [Botrytis fragariae]